MKKSELRVRVIECGHPRRWYSKMIGQEFIVRDEKPSQFNDVYYSLTPEEFLRVVQETKEHESCSGLFIFASDLEIIK